MIYSYILDKNVWLFLCVRAFIEFEVVAKLEQNTQKRLGTKNNNEWEATYIRDTLCLIPFVWCGQWSLIRNKIPIKWEGASGCS